MMNAMKIIYRALVRPGEGQFVAGVLIIAGIALLLAIGHAGGWIIQ
jgi:hypothetical protein